MYRLALAFGIFCIPVAVLAEDCGDLQTQYEMNVCARDDHAKVDAQMNRDYNAYRARLSAEQAWQFRDAQRAWIRFRDLSCAYESSGVKGGSVYPLILSSCLAGMTRERIRQIGELATCKEGNLSCPAWQ